MSKRHNITSGKIYQAMIEGERRGDYLGKTVQMVPHGSDLVMKWIEEVATIPVDSTGLEPEVCLIEVGGTVGDIESMLFLEALRQFQFKVGHGNILFFHVGLVPCLGSVGEQKTKPTQHSVKELRSLGLSPHVIVCRSSDMLLDSTRRKIGQFCHVAESNVISVHDVSNIYHVPMILAEQGVPSIIKQGLGMTTMRDEPDLLIWAAMASTIDNAAVADAGRRVKIAVVGKYTGMSDAYLSVVKSLHHAGIHLGVDVKVVKMKTTHTPL